MSAIRKMSLVDADHVNMMRKYGDKSESEEVESNTYEETVIADLPKTLKSKGSALVGFFQRNSIGHDSSNRMTYKGNAIPGSNYRDLLSDLVRYRDVPPPQGFEALARILKNVNVGRELITNLERYSYIAKLSDNAYDGGSDTSSSLDTELLRPRSFGRVQRKRRSGVTKYGAKRSRANSLAKKWVTF